MEEKLGELEPVQLRMNRLFAWIIERWLDGYDIDGFELQDKMEELNLIRREEYDPEKHEADGSDYFYVLLDEVKALLPAKAGV
jgi:hypothetical protein